MNLALSETIRSGLKSKIIALREAFSFTKSSEIAVLKAPYLSLCSKFSGTLCPDAEYGIESNSKERYGFCTWIDTERYARCKCIIIIKLRTKRKGNFLRESSCCVHAAALQLMLTNVCRLA